MIGKEKVLSEKLTQNVQFYILDIIRKRLSWIQYVIIKTRI